MWLSQAVLIFLGILLSAESRPLSLDPATRVGDVPLTALFRVPPIANRAVSLLETSTETSAPSALQRSPVGDISPTPTTQNWARPAQAQLGFSSPRRQPPKPENPTPRVPSRIQAAISYFNTSSDRTLTTTLGPTGPTRPTSPTGTGIGSSTSPTSQPSMASQNVFLPVSKDQIPANIPKRDGHPVRKDHITDAPGPISTNKFYANFFLGNQSGYSFIQPYSVGWSKGANPTGSFGLAISHSDASQTVFGERSDVIPGNPVRFYANPVGIQSIILSAEELKNSTTLSLSNPQAFSANVILRPQKDSDASASFPLVQGMGFVTGLYDNLQPVIQSQVSFKQVDAAGSPKDGIFKYKASLQDGANWLLYVTPENGADPKLVLVSNNTIRGSKGFNGFIQVAKDPGNGDSIYDGSAGVYPTAANIAGSVTGNQGTYQFSWTKAGKNADNTPLLMFALPHHVEAFDDSSKGRKTDLKLQTTTKGQATACVGDSWTMIEPNLPVDIGFEPWKPGMPGKPSLSAGAKEQIKAVALSELSQDMESQTNLDSMYFSGKALGKFAGAVYTAQELLQDAGLASRALESLKKSFARFVENKQKHPLVYDTVWKGAVSSGTYQTGDIYLDFGNTLYNDHHFHYGYFILTAAIIGHLDRSWLDTNKVWVNMLVRDASNSVSDELFPFSRGFDWFNGHSWAKGLFASIDGKDQESTSEDTMFAYALKMWGKTSGDASMEARGNLMLGILYRSLDSYFLMRRSNVNQPKEFIDNKVTGILFENKCDHATYFGANLEYIQGIHMLPLLPASAYTRRSEFVREEWNAMFAPNATKPADTVEGGWRGVLYANLAIIDAEASWKFFTQPNFNMGWIDGGASRTWYLAYAALLSRTTFFSRCK
ncbi:endo-1,3(4)-beta-glucanase 1 [Coccidioides immitis RMSCC 2394]|uniref:glucan endo-1,3-beta-D-glucosidase n=1 Tax=Coccidioides immitis RMSCC 2394 TaxID=404692 RepID=A0A0J6YE08_COCIT|nr:endo-1,3(4)-beta-glucanase 1 [Coccidioides immitis RMSCC 2394]